MPAWTPTRTLSAALSGHWWLVIALCAATAATNASAATAKATTNESPTVLTSTPPCVAQTARSRSLCFSSSGLYAGRLAEHPRGALDVGEHEGHEARGEDGSRTHGASACHPTNRAGPKRPITWGATEPTGNAWMCGSLPSASSG